MRLIDADALLKDFSFRTKQARDWKEAAMMFEKNEIVIRADATIDFLTEVKLTIENAPTIDRPRGEWIETDNRWGVGKWRCSNCGDYSCSRYDFCHYCGAKMKGGDEK